MMEMTRETTDEEKEILQYLNEIRESGLCNMFDAGKQVEYEFGIPRNEAKRILFLYFKNFQEDGIYDYVKL